MKKSVQIFFLLVVWVSFAKAQVFVPGQIYFGDSSFIEYRAGNLPIIISAPHGGYLAPASIPDRNCPGCVTVRDRFTQEIAQELDTAIYNLYGGYPHIIINRLARIKLDANREIVEAAQGNPIAEQAWREFHTFIRIAKDSVEAHNPRGLLLDLHAHGHAIQRLELGYLLSADNLRLSNMMLDADTSLRNKTGLKDLAKFVSPGTSFAELVRGENSLGTLYTEYGYPAVPSSEDPAPALGDPYFQGGYDVVQHGSRDSTTINAFQVECHFDKVRDSRVHRQSFAISTACVLKRYLDTFFYPTGHGTNLVTSLADDGPGSLREAIGSSRKGDTIRFDPSILGDTITLTSDREICICHDLVIEGPGSGTLAVSAEKNSRILSIARRQSVSISGLSLLNGRTGSVRDGGAIMNDGALTLSNVLIQDNYSGDDGGGIAVSDSASLVLWECVIMGNDCEDDGGGIFFSGDSAEVYNSTFSSNHCESLGAGYYQFEGKTMIEGSTFQDNESDANGGGVRNFQGNMSLVNTTFSGNFAVREGGAIYARAPTTLLHCTIVDNEAWDHGGGIRMTGDTAFFSNTLIAKNLSADEADISTVSGGRFWSQGYNLVGDTSEVRLPPRPGDIMGDDNNPVDPLVFALANNTGPTWTIALDPSSPAIDKGNSITQTDQRGVMRPQGLAVDIGAFELEMNVGIEEIEEQSGWMVYPNPFSQDISIAFSTMLKENTEARLYDISGRGLEAWDIAKGKNEIILNVPNEVGPGIYLLEIEGDKVLLIKNP